MLVLNLQPLGQLNIHQWQSSIKMKRRTRKFLSSHQRQTISPIHHHQQNSINVRRMRNPWIRFLSKLFLHV